MKDVKALRGKIGGYEKTDILMAIIYHIIAAATGFILCRTAFSEKYIPFGISLAAGCPIEFLPSAAIGVFIGYFIPAITLSGFRYVAAALAVFAVRFMLSFNKKLISNHLFSAFLSALSLSITSAVAYGGGSADVFLLSLEVVFCAAGAIVVSRTSGFIEKISRGLTGEELGCLLVLISMCLSGLYKISVFSVSLSAIVGVTLILCTLKFGGALPGNICAISVSLMLFFAGRDVRFCFVIAVASMISGLVLSFGKYVLLSTFFTCTVVFSLMQNTYTVSAPFIVEMLIGSFVFAFLPKSTGIYLGRVFTCYPQISVNNDLNRAVTMRLKSAAIGLKDVKTTVDEVAARLDGINAPSFSSVLDTTEENACGGCKLKGLCWEAKRESTVESMFLVIKQIKKNGAVDESTLPNELRARCLHPDLFCRTINKTYLKYSSAAAASSRIGQIRRAVGDQFEGLSSMLSELSNEFSCGVKFDNAAALTAVTALKNIGVCADECSAPIDKYGRMKISLKLKKGNDTVLNKKDIMKVLSLSCERDFAPPVIKKTLGETFINVSERARLSVDFGACQKSAKEGDMCGDSYSCFPDGQGHFIMLLSDGMGTGGRAAVDSAMASGLMSRLIKSGFGYDCALSLLNSSMLFKSADESLATMDIASIDLFTGNAELYKAGAAPTLVRRGGKTGKAVSTSMPVGILSDVNFDRAGIKLRAGDILVLLSDGAVFDGTDWIRSELERFSPGTAQDLAERLCVCAAAKRQDGHADDITVITAIINKTE